MVDGKGGLNMRPTARGLVITAVLAGLIGSSGCSSASWRDKPTGKDGKPSTISITSPKDGATDVPTSVEIAVGGPDARDATVTLAEAGGATVDGARRPDGSTWVPATQLRYATKYTATVKAGGGQSSATFTTMAKPSNLVHTVSQVGDDLTYGVGMPIVLNFSSDVPKDRRADVERRLFVTSEPAQPGAWNWFNGHEIHYRSREYWQTGTKLSIRLGTGGLPFGGGAYGAADLTIHATIGDKIMMTVDNVSKTMTVTKDDQVLRTMPVSLGKPSSPSSSGNMVVMVKNEWEWFDSTTFGIPADSAGGYRTKVYWPERITWDGQYIHAAPWSVADQGHRNVSHGCVNVSDDNAKWLFGITHLGDPVIVKGTERQLDWGNGWTDWNVDWDRYLKGSALQQPSPSPSQS